MITTKKKENIRIRIFVRNNSSVFELGSLDITSPKNEFYYRPSQKVFSRHGIGTMSKDHKNINVSMPSFDHISFHSDGRIHIKNDKGDEEVITTNKERLNIAETGFVYLLWDAVGKLEDLPIYKEAILKTDIVMDLNTMKGFVMKICLIASTNLLNKNIILTDPEEGFLCWENRGTVDSQKMLSFIFCKYTLTTTTSRRIFIPQMDGIASDKTIEE